MEPRDTKRKQQGSPATNRQQADRKETTMKALPQRKKLQKKLRRKPKKTEQLGKHDDNRPKTVTTNKLAGRRIKQNWTSRRPGPGSRRWEYPRWTERSPWAQARQRICIWGSCNRFPTHLGPPGGARRGSTRWDPVYVIDRRRHH